VSANYNDATTPLLTAKRRAACVSIMSATVTSVWRCWHQADAQRVLYAHLTKSNLNTKDQKTTDDDGITDSHKTRHVKQRW